MISQGGAEITEVILHTSATPGNWYKHKTVQEMLEEIDTWHRNRGWRKIGYHRIIAPNGDIGIGRSLYEQGAHVAGKNQGTIGICLINVNTHKGIKTFDKYFTEQQKTSLLRYLSELEELHGKPLKVTGHNEYANKECPGFKVQDFL